METNDAPEDLSQRILRLVHSADYSPMKPRAVARQLDLEDLDLEDQEYAVKKAIKRLVKRGELSYGEKHLVQPPGAVKSDRSLVTGVFRRAQGGYGFVRPTGVDRAVGRAQDIFISGRKTGDAATGDTVRVRVRRETRDGEERASGTIIEILERDTHQFVGVYRERGGSGYVQVDGNVFAQPIPVGDPGAKSVQVDDKVVIEMVRFPSHWFAGEAVVVEVLGARGKPGVDTLSIMREFRLPERFPEEVLDSARQQAAGFDESLGGRSDLTGETIITIDPEDARDFDDAISLARLDNGHWRLGVHIADVAHFVPEGSALDAEARDRATSVYLPDRVIPMLPETISNHLASLQPGRVRYARSVTIELTAEGAFIAADVARTAMKSARRFTYEEVDAYLADPASWTSRLNPPVHSLLARMHELAMVMRRRRLDRGAIELTLPEVKIELDPQGEVTGARVVPNTVSHQIIEEFMLAANEAVATLLTERGVLFLRRVHAPPVPRKLIALTEFVRELGIECESLESRFEIKRVVAAVADRPERYAVNLAILRSMQKAVYSPKDEGHYALHSQHYCHFTSPIRRYPDLTVHRLFDLLEAGKHPAADLVGLMMLGDHTSDREQRAEAAERELVKVKLLDYMSHRIGHKFAAVVTGVEDFGLFAQGVDLPAEGFIHVHSLQNDHYRFDATSRTLTGGKEGNSFRLGDVIEVEVAHVDVDRRMLDYRFVRRLKTKPAPTPTSKRPGRKKGESPARGKKSAKGTRPKRKK